MYKVKTSQHEEIAVHTASFKHIEEAILFLERHHYAHSGCVRDAKNEIVYVSDPNDIMSPYKAIAKENGFNYVAVDGERYVKATMERPQHRNDGSLGSHWWMRIARFDWPWSDEKLDQLTRYVNS
jgi:hypothetical protein